ncbi:amidohydrolase-domain-containing protein [Lactifluus volemus]|nr:amidohydrolase-domain-containing protein [Lactifluus volemus]
MACLVDIIREHPAIDNHAHPLLTAGNRDLLAFEGLTSEAKGAALEDAVYTLAHSTARRDLAELYGLPPHASWDDVKKNRAGRSYDELCRLCFEKAKIQCILIDDGLGGEILEELLRMEHLALAPDQGLYLLTKFSEVLRARLEATAKDPDVAGFKSVVCYRTGLDVSVVPNMDAEVEAMNVASLRFGVGTNTPLRLADKALNDLVVRTTIEVAAEHGKPVQFHTGLGDADITLTRASPAHLQPLIAAHPQTNFVLLHASYPYMREAGYLTAMYKNVYLDIGEVFPMVSGCGQVTLIRQVLELAPTNKVMWSSDGHWWPETYYLGSIQARRALSSVMQDAAAKDILFQTANRLYSLGLETQRSLS